MLFRSLPSVLLVQDDSKDIPECDELAANIAEEAKELVAQKENEITQEVFREAERQILLKQLTSSGWITSMHWISSPTPSE